MRQVAYTKTVALSCRDCEFYYLKMVDASGYWPEEYDTEIHEAAKAHLEQFQDHSVAHLAMSEETIKHG